MFYSGTAAIAALRREHWHERRGKLAGRLAARRHGGGRGKRERRLEELHAPPDRTIITQPNCRWHRDSIWLIQPGLITLFQGAL